MKNGNLPAYPRLRAFILGTATLHFAGFMIIVFLGTDRSIPLNRSYYANSLDQGTERSGSISLKSLIGSFFALSAAFQGVPAAVPALWAYYRRTLLVNGVQPFRWVEYSFSASCLFLMGAVLNGTRDLYVMVITFVAMWTVMMLGLLQELVAFYFRRAEALRPGLRLRNAPEFFLAHAAGWPLYMALWGTTLDSFSLSLRKNGAPAWVVTFYVADFALFSCFGVNQLVQMVRLYRLPASRPLERIAAQHECAYAALSLAAKSLTGYLFAVAVFAGKQ